MLIRRREFVLLCTTLPVMLPCASLSAEVLGTPVESPILVVVGKITATNKAQGEFNGQLRAGRAVFDRPMLDAMAGEEIKTTTPWYTGEVKFEGVSFARFVKEIGATGDNLVITALDDYSREIPIADLIKNRAILALRRDGQYLSISDKGPLFVVYPYDSDPELKNEKYYSRSVWQVRRIEVR
jgi:hypothetical protein